jgi:hypothetical protein
MEPRGWERFADTMAGEAEEQVYMLTSYALDRRTGYYVKVKNAEGLLRMLVFQGPERPGEKSGMSADRVHGFGRVILQNLISSPPTWLACPLHLRMRPPAITIAREGYRAIRWH